MSSPLTKVQSGIWREVQQQFDVDSYTIDDVGNNSRVLLAANSSEDISYAVKIASNSEYSRRLLSNEADTLQALGCVLASAAIEVPKCHYRSEDPSYMVLSYVSGTKRKREEVRANFSEEEKRCFGNTLGTFVAWYAAEQPVDEYFKDRSFSPRPFFEESLLQLEDQAAEMRANNYPSLAAVACELGKRHKKNMEEGKDVPRIIGHNDLSMTHYLFSETGEHRLTGLIDFGNVRPSTPEREFRQIAFVGQEAVAAAIERYETMSDGVVSRDLLRLWSLNGVVPLMTHYIRTNHLPDAAIKAVLHELCPDKDWSELERIGASSSRLSE